MSQEKAQLIAPQGHFTVPGLNVAGVVTASSFSGNCTGTASSITKGSNVVVGVMTASSFAGDVFGNAAGLSTTTAGLKLGIVTATSFAGNFTGIGSGLTGTPNIVAGLVTATQFIGNTPGLAAGISAGKNLAAGIVTATTFHGDGSNLTGAGSTAYIRQTVGSGTTIDLNNGNIILFEHVNNPTVSFANTSTADDVTFIRPLTNPTAISISTGGVDFDATDDRLTVGASADFTMGASDDFTVEAWVKKDDDTPDGVFQISDTAGGLKPDPGYDTTLALGTNNDQGWQIYYAGVYKDYGTNIISSGLWYHVAIVRHNNVSTLYINGESIGSESDTHNYNGTYLCIGGYYSTTYLWDGKISNFRIVKGTAVYTSDFVPPSAALTNITNTKLLCCQSDSSTTTAAVTPGTITANGDPTAGAQTVSLSLSLGSAITWPSSITWNGGSAPTLLGANDYSKTGQVFNLVTADGGTTWYGYEEVNNTVLEPFGMFVVGNNSHGMLGQNSEVDYSSPVQIPGTWVAASNQLGPVDTTIQIQRKSDGTLWGWGQNTYGSLGHNNRTNYSSPVQIPGTTWAVGASNEQCLWTKTDGTLWAWGRNDTYGQLGLNDRAHRSSPVQVGSGTDWPISHNDGIKFTTSKQYQASGAIKTDGTLWVWGQNGQGQLGLSNTTYYSSPTQIPGTNWKSVSCVWSSMMALKTNGELWAWGMNYNGVLGQNNRTIYSSPKQIPGTTWASIAAGDGSAIATKTDGTLWSWGYNEFGQIAGLAHDAHRSSPVQIPGTTWSTSHLGGGGGLNATVSWTKTDGTLWSWGNNSAGSLGLNQPENSQYSSPVQVPGTTWKRVTASGENGVWLRST